jgi:hypothetical protein
MFYECPTNTGSLLGPQRHSAATFVFKVVHFLRDNFSGLAHSQEHPEVFEHWRNDVRKTS